jgi:2-polyprenyl-3-methyl-5-hydroxy-6-metoxy-1,4-benzoquinol methylase
MPINTRHALAPSQAEISALPLSSNPRIAADLLGGAGSKALDIGCGEGKFTRALTRLFAEVSGIDVKESKIVEARAAAAAEGLSIDFRAASGVVCPLKSDPP